MIVTRTLIAAAALGLSLPALAQTAPATPTAAAPATAPAAGAGLTVGATVKDPQGGTVGTIQSITPAGVVVSTGTVNATLAPSSFAASPTGPIISLTKAQLDAQVQQATAAALDTSLKVGASVRGPQGNQVGTVESITGDQVVVATPKAKAQLARSAFAVDPNGLVIGMTQAQLEAAVAAAAGTAGAAKPAATPGG